MSGLRAPLPALAGLAQDPVEGGHRSQVDALIQQHRPGLGRGGVGEPRRVQHVQDGLALGCGQGAGLHPVPVRHGRRARRGRAGPVPPVPGGLRHARRRARRPGADPRRQQRDRLVGHELDPGPVSAPSEIVSKSA